MCLVTQITTNMVLFSITLKYINTDSHSFFFCWAGRHRTQNTLVSQVHALMDALSTASMSIWHSCPDPRASYLSHVSLTHWSVHFCTLQPTVLKSPWVCQPRLLPAPQTDHNQSWCSTKWCLQFVASPLISVISRICFLFLSPCLFWNVCVLPLTQSPTEFSRRRWQPTVWTCALT